MSGGRKSKGLGALVDKLFGVIEIVIAIFLGVMIFFTFMNVVLRQFSLGFPWSEEIARICFIYLIYLGSIIAAKENQHLMIDTLMTKLPAVGQKILYVIIQLIVIVLMGFLATGAYQNAYNNRNDMIHIVGAVLGVAVIIISLVNLYRVLILKESAVELFTSHGNNSDDMTSQEGGGLQ